jgi:pyridoxal phosphate enzyme (YggS family)
MPFQDLPARIAEVRGRIARAAERGGHGQQVRIVAVTKTHGPEAVLAAVASGIADIGENKVQEAVRKQEALVGSPAAGARWHLIGHLQSNKAKALPRFTLFHALDRESIVAAADAVGRAAVPVPALVQVNVSGEGTKGGYAPGELERLAERLHEAQGIEVRGVMTMAPLEADERQLRRVFGGARLAGDTLRRAGHRAVELSMGMSGDYEVAVEEGATIVRLGTVLFGARS